MTTKDIVPMNRQQLKEIVGLARTLIETADELLATSTRRHPELHPVAWLLKQTHTRIHEILTLLGEKV